MIGWGQALEFPYLYGVVECYEIPLPRNILPSISVSPSFSIPKATSSKTWVSPPRSASSRIEEVGSFLPDGVGVVS